MKIRSSHAQHFKEFLSRQTLLEFFVAVSLGSVFTPIVTNLTTEVILPLLTSWTNSTAGDLFVVVAKGRKGVKYNSIDEAREDGAVVVGYGRVLKAIFVFMIHALAVYTIMSLIR